MNWLQFSPEVKLRIIEYRPIYVGRDMFFTKVLGWLDNDRLLYLEDCPEPGGTDPYNYGKALQVLHASTGEKKLLHWLPSSIAIGYDSWLSARKDVLYFTTSGGYYRGAIGRIRLDTGEYRLLKTDLDLYRPFEELFLEKAASGEKVIHLLNHWKDTPLPIFDLQTGEEFILTPQGVVADEPVWSPAENLISAKVGAPGEPYQVLSTEGGPYLESGTIWVINDRGERINQISIPGKQLGDPLWLPDGKSIVFQALKRIELSPEEQEMLPDKWRLEGNEIYRWDLDGNPVELLLPGGEDFKLERVLNQAWLLAVNYPEGRSNYALVSTTGKDAVMLPPATWQVLGMVGDQVVTCEGYNRICIGYPGQEMQPLATLDHDLLSYHWFVNEQWLVVVETGRNAADPGSLRIIKVRP